MHSFISNMLYNFFTAFGVILGASAFAGIGALINDHPPLKTMIDLATSIKIWAVAIALGGTFSSFQVIEEGIFRGEVRSMIKQAIHILAALVGANAALYIIKLMQRCGQLWTK